MTIHFPSETDTTTQLATGRQHVTRRIRTRRRATRVALIGGVLLAASSGTAATLVVTQASHERVATGVTCYAHDDLGSFSSSAGMAQAVGQPVKAVDVQTKKEMCGLVDSNTSTTPVPTLALCTLPNGSTGGFPIEAPSSTPAEVCDRLGLALLG